MFIDVANPPPAGQEGSTPNFGHNINPTLSGDSMYGANDADAPPVPPWPYLAGVQPNVP